MESEDKREDAISRSVLDCAMRIHSTLGPGMLESAYSIYLAHELNKVGLRVAREVFLPVVYDRLKLDAGYRLDILIDDAVVVELKCVDKLQPIHTAQLLSYLRLGGYRLGMLLNFNVVHMRDGIKRVVNKL